MKSYTDIEQSKKLVEILPHDTADGTWKRVAIAGINLDVPEGQQYFHDGDTPFVYYSGIGIPSWSLSALLELMPIECKLEKTLLDQSDYFTYACEWTGEYRTFEHEDSLDAAFEMVCWLKENDKL